MEWNSSPLCKNLRNSKNSCWTWSKHRIFFKYCKYSIDLSLTRRKSWYCQILTLSWCKQRSQKQQRTNCIWCCMRLVWGWSIKERGDTRDSKMKFLSLFYSKFLKQFIFDYSINIFILWWKIKNKYKIKHFALIFEMRIYMFSFAFFLPINF